MKKLEFILVTVLLLVGIALRSYRINFPLADWHSWRQADTAAVARNFVKEKFDLLYPQTDNLLAMNEYSLPNPNRYFINEFPLYNAVVALIYKQFGINVMYGRMVSIAMSAIGALFLYGLVRRLTTVPVALLTLFFYTFNPYNIYYGRVFMPDPSYVTFSIMAIYWCVAWVSSGKFWQGLLMSLSFIGATLLKPYGLLLALPMVYWVFINWKLKTFRKTAVYFFAVISLIPLWAWRQHMAAHLEGTFSSTWLFNGGDIRFTGAFFRWIIFDRFNRLMFATGGFVLFVIGFVASYLKKNSSLFFVWMLALLAFITIIAKGNVTHDYYQMPVMPVGSFFVAWGSLYLINMGTHWLQKVVNGGAVAVLLVLSLAFGWFEVRGYFNINNMAIVHAGERVDQITPPDSIVIAPYMTDPAFLYQTNRHGWPVGGEIDKKIAEGADYYVTTSKDAEYGELKSKYSLVEENDEYAIIKLSR